MTLPLPVACVGIPVPPAAAVGVAFHMRPRGRAPHGADGTPKTWDRVTGRWTESGGRPAMVACAARAKRKAADEAPAAALAAIPVHTDASEEEFRRWKQRQDTELITPCKKCEAPALPSNYGFCGV